MDCDDECAGYNSRYLLHRGGRPECELRSSGRSGQGLEVKKRAPAHTEAEGDKNLEPQIPGIVNRSPAQRLASPPSRKRRG